MNSEFFGGEAGSHIIAMLSRLRMPIVTTLHTVLAAPTPAQRDVLNQIIGASAKVIVMAEKGQELLRSVCGVSSEKIVVIPHGIPTSRFSRRTRQRTFGFSNKTVV